MPKLNIATIVCLLLCATQFVMSQRSQALEGVVKKYVQEYLEDNQALAVGIVDGEELYHYYLGQQSRHNPNPPDSNSFFELGALSKVLTANILLQTEELNLTTSLATYLPDSLQNEHWSKLSLHQLLTHSANLPKQAPNLLYTVRDKQNQYAHYTRYFLEESLSNYVANKQTVKNDYSYSHWGYAIIGYVLENHYKQLFTEVLNKKINKALETDFKMVDSSQLLNGHQFSGTIAPKQNYANMTASLGLMSNLPDLLKFVNTYVKCDEGAELWGKAVEQALNIQEATHRKHIYAGYGWHSLKRRKKDPLIFTHAGSTKGFHAFVAFIRESQTAVVLLGNTHNNFDQLGFELLELLNR